MKSHDLMRRTFTVSLIALTVVATALRSLAFLFSFDRAVGYFGAGLLSTLLYIVLALIPLTALVYALLARRIADPLLAPAPDPTMQAPLIRVFSIAVGCALAASAIPDAITLVSTGLHWLVLVRMVAALLAIPYFLVPPSATSAWSGIAVLAHCTLMLVTEYFDRYVTMNSPLKLMHQLMALSIMLYLLTELFALIGAPRPRRAAPLAAIAAAYGIAGGCSHVVAALAGGIIPLDYLMRAIVLGTLGLYCTARLAVAMTAASKQNCKTEEG